MKLVSAIGVGDGLAVMFFLSPDLSGGGTPLLLSSMFLAAMSVRAVDVAGVVVVLAVVAGRCTECGANGCPGQGGSAAGIAVYCTGHMMADGSADHAAHNHSCRIGIPMVAG